MKLLHALRHWGLYALIALHVALKYLFIVPLREYPGFLRRAKDLLFTFRHNRIVRIAAGYKLQLYLPAWPSPAFFQAVEGKLLRSAPAPTSIVFSMTRACKLRCPHCYQKTEKGADISDALLLQTLSQVLDAGVSFCNIEGGEPFLRFDRLLSMLEQTDSRVEVWVNTSGFEVTHEQLAALKERGLAGVMVSLHSPEAAVHDAFTGTSGAFAGARNVLALCRELGLGTVVNSVLSEQELADGKLANLMELTKDLGADYVQLIHPKPCGAWLERTEGMQTDKTSLRIGEEGHLFWNSPATWSYPSLAAQVFEERKEGVGCTAGAVDRFYITATGEVQPCEFLQVSFGNVSVEDFSIIYERMRKAFAEPRTDWLCCTQAGNIAALMARHGLTATPIPWEYAEELVIKWHRGEPTPLYQRLGIYHE